MAITGKVITVYLQILFCGWATSDSQNGRRPNIVLIVADDLGWNDVGWHNADVRTPNLDSLAKGGVILNNSYVQPVCSPSRAAILTGLYPYHTGLQHSYVPAARPYGLPTRFTTLPTLLSARELNYETHAVGKWHLGFCDWDYTPTRRGFSSFYGFYAGRADHYTHVLNESGFTGLDFRDKFDIVRDQNGTYSTFAFTKRAEEIIAEHGTTKLPMFLYLAYQNVHAPLQVPKRFTDMYNHVKNADRRKFLGMVSALDEGVGNVTRALREAGLWENTVLIFTTDNGGTPSFGGNDWPLRGAKHTLWEGGTRSVAFIHSSLIPSAPFVYNGLFHAVDWLPTILALAGGDSDAIKGSNIDGIDQWDAIKNRHRRHPRNRIVYNIDELSKGAAIRKDGFKLIVGDPGPYSGWYPPPSDGKSYNYRTENRIRRQRRSPDRGWPFDRVQLYDLIADPVERNNLVEALPGVVTEMKLEFLDYLETLRPAIFPPEDPNCDPRRFDGVWSPGWCKAT